MQFASLAKANAAGGPVNASAPGSIIPSPPPAPPTPNWTATIIVGDQPYTVAAGTYLYSNKSFTMIDGDHYYHAPLINDGTLWMDGAIDPNQRSPHWQYVLAGSTDVVNHGVAAVLAHAAANVGQSDAFTFFNFRQLENSGQIFAWAEAGRAFALWSENIPSVVNSGLIAAYVESGLAAAIVLENGGAVVNQAGGRILAEAPVATAISYYNAGLPSGWSTNIQVNNAGLIRAASTNTNYASIGLSFAHASFQTVRVVNSGTITAEIAIIDRSSEEGQFSPVQSSIQIVANQAGGVINGDIILDRGNDELDNSGTINGGILLGEGDDRFDTTNGTLAGLVDLGWGADLFKGSAAADFVSGDDGNDRMEGNGGNDLLMGGANDDILIGGAGNDGLFSEYGSDLIVTQGGDFVWAGYGNDRIELGDYMFELVSGNEGFDTLVLPAGGRVLDLSAVLAEHALDNIEEIVLGGGKEIVIRAADIPLIAGGAATLRINGSATDKIDLVGAWTGGGTVVIDTISYRQYQLAGQNVLVQGAATVVADAAPPAGAAGLDPVPAGGAAPLPGEGPLDFTPNDKYLAFYVMNQSLTVNPEQTWWNDVGAGVIYSNSYGPTLNLTNYGHLLSYNEAFGGAGTLELSYVGLLENYGTITAASTWDGPVNFPEVDLFYATAMNRGFKVVNHGLIEAIMVHGVALAVDEVTFLVNQGTIHAFSEHGHAIGVDETSLFDNQGTIVAEGGLSAIGITVRYSGASNAGRIEAISGDGGADSIGVRLDTYLPSFVNSGEIVADIAFQIRPSIASTPGAITLTNSGLLAGRIELGAGNDRIDNQGTIDGAARLSGGNDIFDGRGGKQAGGVYGEDGDDVLTGGAGIDRLFGGNGADRLQGGGGADWLDGGAGADTFLFVSLGDSREEARRSDGTKYSPDVIAGFVSGQDRIDLSAIDANAATAADDAFAFIGAGAFSGQAGQLRYEVRAGQAHIFGDVDGNGTADFHIVVNVAALVASDFVL